MRRAAILAQQVSSSQQLKEVRRQGHQVPKALASGRGSAVKYMENDAPRLSHAEKARSLVEANGQATLSTIHHSLEVPYGSLVNICSDESGQPLTFVSRLAEHTASLEKAPRCSLLVTAIQGQGDQLAQARLTLVGTMKRVEKTEARKNAFKAKHPAAYYVDFDDFFCFEMQPECLRYIGGFGEMSWVEGEHYTAAQPDAVVARSDSAVAHMNADHADAVLLMTQAFAGLPEATKATILSLDRYGFDVLAELPDGLRRSRVGFKSRLDTAEDIRPAVVGLTNEARQRLGVTSTAKGAA